jgi:hypothetical protein
MSETLLTTATTTTEGQGAATQETQAQPQTAQAEPQKQAPSTEAPAEIKYELKAPEGKSFDAEALKAYTNAVKDLKLPAEAAQKLLDQVAPVLHERRVQGEKQALEAIHSEWTQASQTDKEFGGDKLKENIAVAQAALEKFGTPELQQFLVDSGLGNHPEIIRAFYRAGKAVSEDKFVGGKEPGATVGPATFNDHAARLYGDTK